MAKATKGVFLVVGLAVLATAGALCAMLFYLADKLSDLDACDGIAMPRPVVMGEEIIYAAGWEENLLAVDGSGRQKWKVGLADWPVELLPYQKGVIARLDGAGEAHESQYVVVSETGKVLDQWISYCPVVSLAGAIWKCPAAGKVEMVDANTGRRLAGFEVEVREDTLLTVNAGTGSLWLSEMSGDSSEKDDASEVANTLVKLSPHSGKPLIVKMQHTWVTGLPDDGALVTAVAPKPANLEKGDDEDDADAFVVAIVKLSAGGEEMWRRSIGAVDASRVEEVGRVTVNGNRIAVGTQSSVVVLGLDGSERWKLDGWGGFATLTAAGDGWLVTDGGMLARTDANGRVQWQFAQDSCHFDEVFQIGDLTYIRGDNNGWGCLLAVKDGVRIWDYRHRGAGKPRADLCEWLNWNGTQPLGTKGVLVSTDQWNLRMIDPLGTVIGGFDVAAGTKRGQSADPL